MWSVYTTIGGGAPAATRLRPGAPETRKATLTIQLTRAANAPRQAGHRRRYPQGARSACPGVRIKVGLGGSAENTCWR